MQERCFVTESPQGRPGDTYQPQPEPESAGRADEGARLTNSARALSLGALLLGRRRAIEGIESDIERLGVPLSLGRALSAEERRSALLESEQVLRRVQASEVIEREFSRRSSIASRSREPR